MLLIQAGKSVLFYAIAKRNMEALEMLIASKANIAITDSVSLAEILRLGMRYNLWVLFRVEWSYAIDGGLHGRQSESCTDFAECWSLNQAQRQCK